MREELVGLDNGPEEWRASVEAWIQEGVELVARIRCEALAHQRVATELAVEGRRVALLLRGCGAEVDGRSFAGIGAGGGGRRLGEVGDGDGA